jgi:hypothetical protein
MSRPSVDGKIFPRPLVDAWRADTASTGELRIGYRRFVRQRTKNSAVRRLSSWLLGGAVLGMGLAQAASAEPWRWFSAHQSAAAVPPAARAAAKTQAFGWAEPAPKVLPPEASADAPERTVARISPVRSARVVASSATDAAPYVQEQWQRVAAALRDNDYARAELALVEAERSATGREHDAARLARAQLLSSHGHVAQALELVTDLEQHGQSQLVRDRARDLRARLAKIDAEQRSSGQAADVKQP